MQCSILLEPSVLLEYHIIHYAMHLPGFIDKNLGTKSKNISKQPTIIGQNF